MKKWIYGLVFILSLSRSENLFAQRFLMDLVDTTNHMGKGMLSIYERYNRLRVSGYIQPQFQYIESEGAETFSGGNFAPLSNNRFMIRRGRLRIDYAHLNDNDELTTNFVFQFDGTERGVAIRDFWGRFYENKFKLFSVTTGMFARPFGYEINLASPNRETPERGRMSQILMKTERDIGLMVTVNDRNKGSRWSDVKLDVGVFNGQGMSGPVDYDSHKDIIARLSIKAIKLPRLYGLVISAGLSGYAGGITSQSNVLYRTRRISDNYNMVRDSASSNYKKVSPRNYSGADIQFVFPNRHGQTEFRAEYIRGKQTATLASSETPGVYPITNGIKDPLYLRNFDGGYFYFIQHLGSEKHQFVVKYDWYDPNKKVSEKEITGASGFSKADLRYNTLGFGYVYYANSSLKFMAYYDIVQNEKSDLEDFSDDVPDNVVTCRVQYNF